jgi:antibiotic biosynthesis monooxygenase (ABM) superfamily enzyme
MITYQVTITVNTEVETDFIKWMKRIHIPNLIATGLVKSYHILKTQTTSHTYAFQYHFDNQKALETYSEQFAPALKQEVIDEFPNQFTATREIFEWI